MRWFVLLIVVECLGICKAAAQRIAASTEWEQRYYSSARTLLAVIPIEDGGYLLGGLNRGDCVLVKIGRYGELQWEKAYGGSGNEVLRALRRTTDGGYVFVASTTSAPAEISQRAVMTQEDVWVVKVDATGNKQWERTLGAGFNDSPGSIWESRDGGFIVARISPEPFSIAPYWLVKLNPQADEEWIIYAGVGTSGRLFEIIQTADGGYVLAGDALAPSNNDGAPRFGGRDAWAMKVDAIGNKEWERFFGGTRDEIFFSLEQTTDGGLILGGSSSSTPSGNKRAPLLALSDCWLVKVDAAGNKEWDRSFAASTNGYEQVRVVRQTPDQGYVFGHNSGGRGRLVKLDSDGRQQWDQWLGRVNDSRDPYTVELATLELTRDGGYILAGSFSIPNAGAPGIFGSWVGKVEKVLSQAGEVITWPYTPGVMVERADHLSGQWKADQSMVFTVGDASAMRLIPVGAQGYYQLHSTRSHISAPSRIELGGLLSWPAYLKQALEYSPTKESAWEAFPGEQGTIGEHHYAVIPQNLRQHYFRARKAP